MSEEEMKQNAMNILAYRQIGLIEATDTLYNTIQEMLNHIDKLEKSNKEWFAIADNILRATNKYGEISIGEVVDYIDKMQKENELLKAPFEYANGNTLDKRYVELNFISKDKIKELAQEYKPNQSNTFIESQERYIELVKKLELLGE